MKGIVKKIVHGKNFGFIRADVTGAEFFFHRSALKNVSWDELEEGQEVEFEDVEGEKGPRAEDVYA